MQKKNKESSEIQKEIKTLLNTDSDNWTAYDLLISGGDE